MPYVPLPKLPSSSETAELLIHHVFRFQRIPFDIVSDRGPQFSSQVWKAFCQALEAIASLTSSYHPQSYGQTEHANQDLETSTVLPPIILFPVAPSFHELREHNTVFNSSTGMLPFMVVQGFQPPLFPDQETEVAVPSVQANIKHCRQALLNLNQGVHCSRSLSCSQISAWAEGLALLKGSTLTGRIQEAGT